MKRLKQDLFQFRFALIPVILYLIGSQLIFGYTCIFRILFKIDCPGCGLTRAFFSLLKGDISSALHYNYTIFFWLITIILFIIDRYIKPLKIKPFPALFIITSIITIVRYLLIVLFNISIF